MFEGKWIKLLPAAVLLLGGAAAEAKVELSPVFSDNAVLQRQMAVPVWGKADPGEAVTVKFADQTKETTAGNDGKWMVKLDPMEASKENRQLTATGKENTVTVSNVLVGEVWLASGQSNMQQPLWGGSPNFRHQNKNASGKEVADKTDIPTFRFVRMPNRWSETPSDNEKVVWNVAKPGPDLENASAVAFFFGRELAQELDVPVGILGAYWGGTRIEPWTTPEGFASVPEVADISRRVNSKIAGTKEYKEISDKMIADYSAWLEQYKQATAKGELPPPPPAFSGDQMPYKDHQQPTVLYNKMLRTFVPYAMRGAIWYQGESNRGDRMLYRYKMQAMLNGWKTVFLNPSLKLYFAQLAPYNYGNNPTLLPEIWEAQQVFADTEKDAGMAVINDVGNVKDIHPADKETVGKRLAYLALNRDYGKTDIKADSPKLKSAKVEDNSFVLEFDHVESWKVLDGNDIPHFEVAGMEQEFFPAKAEIRGKNIVVTSDKVAKPQNLRYMWSHVNEGKLANEAGLMLGAFRIGEELSQQKLFDALKENNKLVFEYDLKSGSGFGDKTKVNYITDNSAEITGKITRVTYFAVLEKEDGSVQFVSAAMDPFTQNAKQLGVPVKSTGAAFQTRIRNLNVLSNVADVKNGIFTEGNIEFWPNNYGGRNTANVPGADNNKYDFGDEKSSPEVGYGSMQIHNFQQKQTVFAYNCFAANANADIGIGNRPGAEHPDWTFSKSGGTLKKATLYVFVKEEPRASDAEILAPVTAKVPEAASMKPVYVYDLKSGSGFGDRTQVNYIEDRAGAAKAKKVAYFALLKDNEGKESWVFAKMDSFSPEAKKLGVPVKASGAVFQQNVANLEVKTNVEGVKTGAFAEGNIEFWPHNYGQVNQVKVPGASDEVFDFGDRYADPNPGYGSMQIHNFLEKQTVFAYNNFSAGAGADVGIGNAPDKNTDWTFSKTMSKYASATLYVMIEE